MKIIVGILVAIGLAVVVIGAFFGCDEKKQEKILAAGNAIFRTGEDGQSTPDVVAKQQRAEMTRQNRTWTPENQAKYPVEYCQAQLEKLDEHAVTLEAGIHRINVAASECRRKTDECAKRIEVLSAFLEMAKSKYREADANNAFPVDFNGYLLSKQQAQEKIVQANRQIPGLRKQLLNYKNLSSQLEKKKNGLFSEQRRLAALRERVQSTINDLRTKKVIDGNKNIADVLNSLSDSIDSLGSNVNNPDLNDVIAPTGESTRQSEFESIMGR